MSEEKVPAPSFTNSMNTGTLLTIGGLLVTMAVNYGVVVTKLEGVKENIARIEVVTSKVPEIDYRSIANEEAIKALVNRQESQTSNLSNQLRELNNAIGGLQTSQAVILQRIDSFVSPQRADVAPPRSTSRP